MKCPQCHEKTKDGKFCEKCGAPLTEEAADLTRVMPPLHVKSDTTDTDNKEKPENDDTSAKESVESDEASADHFLEESTEDIAENTENEEEESENTSPPLPAFLFEDDENADFEEDEPHSLRKKIITIIALIIGIGLAAIAVYYLFSEFFGTTEPEDPAAQVKAADTVAPDTSLAEDTIVGHWRHYNEGSVIEKIGTARYRWTIGNNAYELKFQDNQYVFEDESGSTYAFVLPDADHIQLISSADASGGLITNPIFESGYICGRVGQDGTMAESMRVNPDAFAITGKTYAELAGTYGPGSLSVIGDNQYIVFRAEGGNFAVQFEGETVPLKANDAADYDITKLASIKNMGYEVVPLASENVTLPEVTTPDTNSGAGTDTNTGTDNTPSATTPNTSQDANSTTESNEDTEYTVEIPDMPTFPSTSAIATGVVWADLGFVIDGAPDTLSVADLSAVLGIALEVGTAPANDSGFSFYGMEEGYFAGTYTLGDHAYYISGYGNSNLAPEKTIIFIQQVS